MWSFRLPRGPATTQDIIAPRVSLSPEIAPWFDSATVVASTPSRYTVQLAITPRYLQSIGSDREVHFGFHLIKSGTILGQGELRTLLRANEPSHRLTLPNAERVDAREIRLYLTH